MDEVLFLFATPLSLPSPPFALAVALASWPPVAGLWVNRRTRCWARFFRRISRALSPPVERRTAGLLSAAAAAAEEEAPEAPSDVLLSLLCLCFGCICADEAACADVSAVLPAAAAAAEEEETEEEEEEEPPPAFHLPAGLSWAAEEAEEGGSLRCFLTLLEARRTLWTSSYSRFRSPRSRTCSSS